MNVFIKYTQTAGGVKAFLVGLRLLDLSCSLSKMNSPGAGKSSQGEWVAQKNMPGFKKRRRQGLFLFFFSCFVRRGLPPLITSKIRSIVLNAFKRTDVFKREILCNNVIRCFNIKKSFQITCLISGFIIS